MLVASSHGVRRSKLKADGRNVLFVANAFYYPAARPASGNAKKRSKKRAAAPTKLRRQQDK